MTGNKFKKNIVSSKPALVNINNNTTITHASTASHYIAGAMDTLIYPPKLLREINVGQMFLPARKSNPGLLLGSPAW